MSLDWFKWQVSSCRFQGLLAGSGCLPSSIQVFFLLLRENVFQFILFTVVCVSVYIAVAKTGMPSIIFDCPVTGSIILITQYVF